MNVGCFLPLRIVLFLLCHLSLVYLCHYPHTTHSPFLSLTPGICHYWLRLASFSSFICLKGTYSSWDLRGVGVYVSVCIFTCVCICGGHSSVFGIFLYCSVVVWMWMALMGSYTWMLGHQLVGLFGKDKVVSPCWKGCVLGGGLRRGSKKVILSCLCFRIVNKGISFPLCL